MVNGQPIRLISPNALADNVVGFYSLLCSCPGYKSGDQPVLISSPV